MALDFDAQASAIAARFLAAALTAPTGYATIRSSTADKPAAVGPTPAVVVSGPQEGSFETGNGKREGVFGWTVRFYLDQTSDLARSAPALRKWLAVLVYQLQTVAQLGGTVDRCVLDGFRIGMLTYGGKDYTGIELDISTTVHEPWLATA